MARFLQVDDGWGRQRGCPAAHVLAVGVEAFGLRFGVEDAEEGRGVIAAAGHPLPIKRVGGGIGVHQGVPEPFLAQAPVDAQVLGEEGAHHHAHAIVHIPGGP